MCALTAKDDVLLTGLWYAALEEGLVWELAGMSRPHKKAREASPATHVRAPESGGAVSAITGWAKMMVSRRQNQTWKSSKGENSTPNLRGGGGGNKWDLGIYYIVVVGLYVVFFSQIITCLYLWNLSLETFLFCLRLLCWVIYIELVQVSAFIVYFLWKYSICLLFKK